MPCRIIEITYVLLVIIQHFPLEFMRSSDYAYAHPAAVYFSGGRKFICASLLIFDDPLMLQLLLVIRFPNIE